MTTSKIQFAFFDLETDPFAYDGFEDALQTGRFDIAPFSVGCLYGDDFRPYFHAWGDDCISAFMAEVDANPVPTIYYAHNGGKFDMRWIFKYLPAQKLSDINGRLVKAHYGIHEFRDSFALFAQKLSAIGGKKEIKYSKMKRSVREMHKVEILDYLYTDCDVLRNAVLGLMETSKMKRAEFKQIKSTAAGIAFKALNKEMQDAADFDGKEYRKERENAQAIENEKTRQREKPGTKPREVKQAEKGDPKYRLNILGMPYPFIDFAPLHKRDKNKEKTEQILKRKRKWDQKYRDYYFGGTVRVGRAGVFDGEFTQIDARSMYSTSMVQFAHPISDKAECYVNVSPENFKLAPNGDLARFPGYVYAIEFIGLTVGILGTFRDGVNTLGFRRDVNRMISHEFKEGIRLGMIRVEKVLSITVFKKEFCTDFKPFSEKYYALRNEEKALRGKDKDSEEYKVHDARQLYYKTMLASAYGKLAQDYRNFKDVYWRPLDSVLDDTRAGNWDALEEKVSTDGLSEKTVIIGDIKTVPVDEGGEQENYYNVLTAASITAGARALLMRKISQVVSKGMEFIYCDTDSVLFRGRPDSDIATGADALGEWAIDQPDIYKVAIAGAKTYALYFTEGGKREKCDDETGEMHQLVKTRSKGAIIPADEVVKIAADPARVYQYVSEAPQSGLHGEMMALVRDIQATAKPVPYGTISDYLKRGIEPRQLLNPDGGRYTVRELRDMETSDQRAKRAEKSKVTREKAATRKVKRAEKATCKNNAPGSRKR